MKIISVTVIRREARLEEAEFVEIRTSARTTFVTTGAVLETMTGSSGENWTFTAVGYRREARNQVSASASCVTADRELTFSSVSGAEVPAGLLPLFELIREGDAS